MTPAAAPPPGALTWTSAIASHAGAVRETNEDSCLDAAEFGLWAVADGMGGHEAGQIASRMVIDALDREPDRSSEAVLVADITGRLQMANDRLRQISRDHYGGRTIGSTIAVVLAHATTALCLWAGDSRIYRLRAGRLSQLSHDHSAVAEMVNQGLIAVGEAKSHRLRNVITRAVGAHDRLELAVHREPLADGDVLLLCTDGLNKVVSDPEIAALLAGTDCAQTAASLVELAVARAAPDNVTVCVMRVSRAPAGSATAEGDDTVPQPS